MYVCNSLFLFEDVDNNNKTSGRGNKDCSNHREHTYSLLKKRRLNCETDGIKGTAWLITSPSNLPNEWKHQVYGSDKRRRTYLVIIGDEELQIKPLRPAGALCIAKLVVDWATNPTTPKMNKIMFKLISF